jgi:hypothetical protein
MRRPQTWLLHGGRPASRTSQTLPGPIPGEPLETVKEHP